MDLTRQHPTHSRLGPVGKLWTPAHVRKLFEAQAETWAAVRWNDYFHQLLDLLECPHTTHNARALCAWAGAEGGSAWFNLLNTTRYAPGSWDYNFAHVKSYPTLAAGLFATAATLRQTTPPGDFSPILRCLRINAPAASTLRAVESSNWGTGGLALRVLPLVQADYDAYGQRHVSPT